MLQGFIGRKGSEELLYARCFFFFRKKLIILSIHGSSYSFMDIRYHDDYLAEKFLKINGFLKKKTRNPINSGFNWWENVDIFAFGLNTLIFCQISSS